MRSGKGDETVYFLMESLGDKFIDIVTQRVFPSFVCWFTLYSLHIYYTRYCASTGDTVVIVAIPALTDIGVWVGEVITSQLKLNSVTISLWKHR